MRTVFSVPAREVFISKLPDARELLRSPINLLAFGFGTGLAPVAPGTVGTLPALLLWVPLSYLHWMLYLAIVLAMAVAGVWICQRTSDSMGVHDHGGIVWDEIVGYLIAVFLVPFSLTAMVIGFLLFRLFDILKPWPISWADKKVSGGLGIMLDDIIAGAASCVVLQLLYRFFPSLF